jgi:hypothetical protein
LLCAVSMGWIVALNVARITFIALALNQSIDLSRGLAHDLLGVATFAMAMVFSLSSDCLLIAFLGTTVVDDPIAEQPNTVTRPMSYEPVVLVVAFVGALAASWWWTRGNDTPLVTSFPPVPAELDGLSESSLPEEILQWRQVVFRTEVRPPNSLIRERFGANSKSWTYRNGAILAAVSVDWPFTGWHELTMCYRGVDWTLEEHGVEEERQFVRATMTKTTGEHGYLLFQLLDGRGLPIPAVKGGKGHRTFGEPSARDRAPTYQIQTVVFGYRPLNAKERSEVEALFLQVVDQLPRHLARERESRQ